MASRGAGAGQAAFERLRQRLAGRGTSPPGTARVAGALRGLRRGRPRRRPDRPAVRAALEASFADRGLAAPFTLTPDWPAWTAAGVEGLVLQAAEEWTRSPAQSGASSTPSSGSPKTSSRVSGAGSHGASRGWCASVPRRRGRLVHAVRQSVHTAAVQCAPDAVRIDGGDAVSPGPQGLRGPVTLPSRPAGSRTLRLTAKAGICPSPGLGTGPPPTLRYPASALYGPTAAMWAMARRRISTSSGVPNRGTERHVA
ncbi:hypothetical protein RKD20_001110 [Streptomyces sp. SLBN-8D4]